MSGICEICEESGLLSKVGNYWLCLECKHLFGEDLRKEAKYQKIRR